MRNRRKRRESRFVVCPRCGLKSLTGTESCPECGLVFSRLNVATNKDAKRKIRRGDRDFIIMTNNLPSDVNYYKLLAVTLFFGVFGGHCFYVGRYWRGSLLLTNFLALLMFVIFNEKLITIDGGRLIAALSTIGGLIMLVWVVDVVWVFIKKFKVPIAIDLDAVALQDEETMNVDEWRSLGEENAQEIVISEEKDDKEKVNKRKKKKQKQEEIKQDEDSSRN